METKQATQPMAMRFLIERVEYAMCSDETRYNLNGVHFERSSADVLAVATDGHRMAVAVAADNDFPLPENGVTVGGDQIKALKKTLHRKSRGHFPAASVGVGRDWVELVIPGRPSCRLGIEGDFPTWRQVVPNVAVAADFAKLADPARVADAFEALAGITDEMMVAAEITGHALNLTVDRDLPDGFIKGQVRCEATGGNPAAFHVNGHYMAAAIRGLGGAVSLYAGADKHSPLMLKGGPDFAVVMPMRGPK